MKEEEGSTNSNFSRMQREGAKKKKGKCIFSRKSANVRKGKKIEASSWKENTRNAQLKEEENQGKGGTDE